MESLDYGILDTAGLSAAIFFPRGDDSRARGSAEDVVLDVGDGICLGSRFYRQSPDLPTILYWHGNGEVVGDHDGIAPLYAAAGVNLFVADFRGYGKSAGRPSFADLVGDGPRAARKMLAHLDGAGFGARRFVMGRSLGSHPALEIAARMGEEISGLIIESGASNINGMTSRLAGAVDPEALETLVRGHTAKVASITMPALIIHGEWDELIPVERAAWLYDTLGSMQKELVTIPRAGHNDILWVGQARYFDAIKCFAAG